MSSACRDFLRYRTDALHRRVDAAFSRFDLADAEGLEKFLSAQAAALLPVERALEQGPSGGAAGLLHDWAARRRSHLLEGLPLDPPSLRFAPFRDRARMLGALYVLEGSKIGARLLLGRVAPRAGGLAEAATRFLGYGRTGGGWASFLDQLERQAAAPDYDGCLDGATTTFELFEAAAILVADRNLAVSQSPVLGTSRAEGGLWRRLARESQAKVPSLDLDRSA